MLISDTKTVLQMTMISLVFSSSYVENFSGILRSYPYFLQMLLCNVG